MSHDLYPWQEIASYRRCYFHGCKAMENGGFGDEPLCSSGIRFRRTNKGVDFLYLYLLMLYLFSS